MNGWSGRNYPSDSRLCTKSAAQYWNAYHRTGENLVRSDDCSQIINFGGYPRVGLATGQSISQSGSSMSIGQPYLTYADEFYDLYRVYAQSAPFDFSPRTDFYLGVGCYFFTATTVWRNNQWIPKYKYVGKGYDRYRANKGNLSNPFTFERGVVISGQFGSVRAYYGQNRAGGWEHIHMIGITPNRNPRETQFYYADGESIYNVFDWTTALSSLPTDGVFIYDLGRGNGSNPNSFDQNAVLEGFWYDRTESQTVFEVDYEGWTGFYDDDRDDYYDDYYDYDYPEYDPYD